MIPVENILIIILSMIIIHLGNEIDSKKKEMKRLENERDFFKTKCHNFSENNAKLTNSLKTIVNCSFYSCLSGYQHINKMHIENAQILLEENNEHL